MESLTLPSTGLNVVIVNTIMSIGVVVGEDLISKHQARRYMSKTKRKLRMLRLLGKQLCKEHQRLSMRNNKARTRQTQQVREYIEENYRRQRIFSAILRPPLVISRTMFRRLQRHTIILRSSKTMRSGSRLILIYGHVVPAVRTILLQMHRPCVQFVDMSETMGSDAAQTLAKRAATSSM